MGKISPKPFPLFRSAFTRSRRASQAFPVFPLSIVLGVGQPANCAATSTVSKLIFPSLIWPPWYPPLPSLVVGVGHPVQSLSDVRCAEARSAGIDRSAGVARSFQVSLYKVEPTKAVFARNLFSKHNLRSALDDEMVEGWP
jgi:hypothetical protein